MTLQRIHPDSTPLARLIQAVGLEDAGAYLAQARPEQLPALFDELLWEGDRLDVDRLWLTCAQLAGWSEARLLGALEALDDDLLLHALVETAWVIDVDALIFAGLTLDGAHVRVERLLDSAPTYELDGFTLLVREERGFDVLLEALTTLDKEDPRRVRRLLDEAAAITSDALSEPDAFCEALSLAEALADEVSGAREDRRAALGFLSAAEARAFLEGARRAPFDERPAPTLKRHQRRLDPSRRLHVSALEEGLGLLRVGEGLAGRLRALAAARPGLAARRLSELAFLANALVAAGERPSPEEAARMAARLCEAGLAWALARGEAAPLERDLVRLFKVGLSLAEGGAPPRE